MTATTTADGGGDNFGLVRGYDASGIEEYYARSWPRSLETEAGQWCEDVIAAGYEQLTVMTDPDDDSHLLYAFWPRGNRGPSR